MDHWKKKNLSLRSFETGNMSTDNLRNTRPRWVDTWACGTVRWYWSAVTLSIDHSIDVQLVFFWAPKLARKCESKHWFPCGADGRSVARSVYGHVITKFSGMGRFPQLWGAARGTLLVISKTGSMDTFLFLSKDFGPGPWTLFFFLIMRNEQKQK